MRYVLRAIDRIPVSWIFCASSVVTCSVMLVVTPPMQVPDEPVHMLRAYHISMAQLLSTRERARVGGILPQNLLLFYKIAEMAPKDITRSLFDTPPQTAAPSALIAYNSSAFYPPVGYLPQAIGIAVARCLNTSPLGCLYAGRLVNALCYILLACLAIEIMPSQKCMLAAIALLPMSLFMAASVSPDAFTNSLALLFISCNLALASKKDIKLLRCNAAVVCVGLAFMLALSKACAPLILLPLAVPAAQFATTRRYWLWVGAVILVYAISAGLWGYFNQDLYVSADATKNPAEQWAHMCSNPTPFLRSVVGAIAAKGTFYAESFVGTFGWLRAPLPRWLVFGTLTMLVLLSFVDATNSSAVWPLQTRIVGFTLFMACCSLMFVWLYLSWCPVGWSAPLEGIQGRYLIAISPLLFAPLMSLRRPSWECAAKIVVMLWSVTAHSCAIITLISYHS